MPKIEIIDKIYFYKSIIMLLGMIGCILLGFVMGKGWHKKIKFLFKSKK